MMGFLMRRFALCLMVAMTAQFAAAQTAGVAFGGIKGDPTLPVDVTAETLTISQKDGSAEFAGKVLVIQGAMRLSADLLRVEYKADKSGVARLFASGNVLLVNATDAAAADEAIYSVDEGQVVMLGNVRLSQGATILTAPKMTVDLITGLGTLEGGVKTSFAPQPN
jgi:lipopolysaccharide export system protein LptA